MPTWCRKHQLQNSLIYHVYNRGNNKNFIFNEPGDFRHFKDLLRSYAFDFSTRIYHWVIMSSHYHLLLEITDPEKLSKLMAGINLSYTYYHHKKYGSAGFLWQGRFKTQPVQKEKYLCACGRYIERNPVRAGIVTTPAEYEFSSARFYCLGETDGITTESPEFRQFGNDIAARKQAYVNFLRDFDQEAEKRFTGTGPVGDKEFTQKLIINNGRFIPRRRGRHSKYFLHKRLCGR